MGGFDCGPRVGVNWSNSVLHRDVGQSKKELLLFTPMWCNFTIEYSGVTRSYTFSRIESALCGHFGDKNVIFANADPYYKIITS